MDIDRIERRDHISVAEFVRNFLQPGIPVVLGSALTEHWQARHDWVVDGKPNFARICELYGSAIVPVAHCNTPYFNDQKRTEMPLCKFLDLWQRSPEEKLYCKDFHFTKHGPPDYIAYTPLPHVSDDWLNLFYDLHPELEDNYRFCYLGGNGTWTPFHQDVYRSYSWSANICGEKKWVLVPPGQDHLFTDGTGQTVYNLFDYDDAKFPRLGELKAIEIVQRAGEVVFVPSGWWHQVRNTSDTISINHNWANEYNLPVLYSHLRHSIEAVHHALRDIPRDEEFASIAQVVLRSDSGMDYRWFFAFVSTLASEYISALHSDQSIRESSLSTFDSYFTSPQTIRFALSRISTTLDLLLQDDVSSTIDGLVEQIDALKARLDETIRPEK
ncbi:hypothetical protein BX070DRAFT_227980 [Coemansia spiralis]|nr:hypothetical protein BX070DRAFT_227980 [Coemansia spiralis]